MVGAYVERIKFSAMLWFSALWALFVYLPVCHMVWGGDGGFFADKGVIDFAGGIVVHITAGVGALVACIVIGKRRDYPNRQILPHNLPMTITGAGMLWVGWFGFNGGSALGANSDAAMAILVTHISAATGALGWMVCEWIKVGKPSGFGTRNRIDRWIGGHHARERICRPVGSHCHRSRLCRPLLLGLYNH